ncbi:MAG: O-antigen ligase family protein, partial [Acholeplasma sp.]|nr:O-antigen ligase family protein [Acholeplasma sp.]
IQINLFNLDISRLSISSIIDSGGTNRIFLWENVINNVINNKPFLGYGPGHPTSSELIFSLIHRTYSHTHNTLIEAFTELGLLGLLFFSIILINAFKSAYDKAKNNQNYYVVLGIFIGILINGIGESYFVSATQWIVIALAISSYKNTIHNEAYIEA